MKHLFFTLFLFCSSLIVQAQDFRTEPDEAHCFLLLPTEMTNLSELGAEIAKHNHAHHDAMDLAVSMVSMQLEEQKVFYYIPNFKNKATALAYYHSLSKHESPAIFEDNALYYFIISKSNLNEVLKAKSLKAYFSFFETVYLGIGG